MRILVTGSNGQLGTELQRLLEPTPHEMLGVDIDTCDISDRDQCLGAITGWSPDLIIHGAALTGGQRKIPLGRAHVVPGGAGGLQRGQRKVISRRVGKAGRQSSRLPCGNRQPLHPQSSWGQWTE